MSRSGSFYVVKAMERAAAGTTTASPSRVPPGRADDHDAPETIRAHGDRSSLLRRVFAAVSRGIGGAPGQTGRRRLGRAVRAD
jgi:hypothetical protein